MKLKQTISLFAVGMFHHVRVFGFTKPEEEVVRATMSRIPPELMYNVLRIVAAPELNAKHGRYLPESKTVLLNPYTFKKRQRFGHGQGWIHHAELVVVHEFGHSIYDSLTDAQQQQWLDLSGWMKGTKDGQAPPYEELRPGWPYLKSKWTHKKNVQFTRHYAEKDPNEDFADCFAFLLLSKGHQMAPAKRAFVEQIIKSKVHAYAKVSIESPDKPYGEKYMKANSVY